MTEKGVDRKDIVAVCLIDTANEVEYYHNGGILHYLINIMVRFKAKHGKNT